MKNHRHRRLKDLLFLSLILSLISLVPAISLALLTGQAHDLSFKNITMIAQNEDDVDEEIDNFLEEVEPPDTKRVPPARPVPLPAPPVTTPSVQVKPPEVKSEAPEKPVLSTPPAGVKPPEVKGEAPIQPAPPPAEAKPPEVQEEVPVKPMPPKPERKPADVSFFFDDADVYEVIQTIFGEVLKVNYIVDPKIKGRVNFRTTTPIPKDEVLSVMEIILRLNGIAIVEEKGLYRIIAITDIPKEPAPIRFGRNPEAVELKGIAIVQVVQLQYISSTEIIKILTSLLSQGGFVLDIPPNFIIIADTDANVRRLLQVVDIFDSEKLKLARPQVYVYPVQNGKAKDVAAMLQQIFLGAKPATPAPTGQQPTTTPRTTTPAQVTTPSPPPRSGESVGGEALVSEGTKIFADEIANTIIILATPEDYATIAEAIKKIDIVPRQVMMEAMIAAVTLTDELNFGVSWLLQNDIKITGLKPFGNDDTVTLKGPLELKAPIPSSTFSFTAIDEAGRVKLLLQSLASEDKVKILASPHILVLDNREASIQIGQQVPIATSTLTTAEATGSVTSSIQYKDIGIILKVKPQVNESGLVSLEISQEISKLGSTVVIADQSYQGIDKIEAKTNLVSRDGQTIVIGGLIREDVTGNRTGIPFLSKIPILGYLFGSTLNKNIRNELIILLTPHVMRSMQEAKDITSDYVDRFTRGKKDITREQLMKGLKEEKEKNYSPNPVSP